jgi:predicted phosphodiesterase
MRTRLSLHVLWATVGTLTLASACAVLSPRPTYAPLPADAPTEVRAPESHDSVRFAVLGDTGTGGSAQYEVAAQLERARAVFPFEFVIMVGDNMYGPERPRDFVHKFEVPYKPLLDAGIPFYATLGNHDDPNQRFYEPFNMGGERYYTFRKASQETDGVRFFALDSTYMGEEQLAWLRKQLEASGSRWKIAFFHHPLYSSGGRHGSEEDLRAVLEPLFLEHGVNVVFAGHEHLYERLKPQKGITYFTAGASAKLRMGDLRKTEMTAVGFDSDYSFMLVEIAGEAMHFQAITRTGRLVDSGTIARLAAEPASPAPTTR